MYNASHISIGIQCTASQKHTFTSHIWMHSDHIQFCIFKTLLKQASLFGSWFNATSQRDKVTGQSWNFKHSTLNRLTMLLLECFCFRPWITLNQTRFRVGTNFTLEVVFNVLDNFSVSVNGRISAKFGASCSLDPCKRTIRTLTSGQTSNKSYEIMINNLYTCNLWPWPVLK